jgi:L-alanine-DL-glutamate epimerase-like enolase superfamily enzyme
MRDAKIDRIAARAYRIPTDQPEADGTFAWTSTTLIVVEVQAAGQRGLGYSYGEASAARLVESELADVVLGGAAMAPPAAWRAMVGAVRNIGRQGIAANAIGAVDVALWDLKARLLDLPLARLLGCHREDVPVYGSGGFSSYSIDQLQRQLARAGAARGGGRSLRPLTRRRTHDAAHPADRVPERAGQRARR